MNEIPENHKKFMLEVARLAKENDLTRCEVILRPGYLDTWHGDVKGVWESGRHGAASNGLLISSTQNVLLKLDEPT